MTASVLSAAEPVTALDGNEDDVSSVFSGLNSIDNVTGRPRGTQSDYLPSTAATVEQRLQEAVDNSQPTWGYPTSMRTMTMSPQTSTEDPSVAC